MIGKKERGRIEKVTRCAGLDRREKNYISKMGRGSQQQKLESFTIRRNMSKEGIVRGGKPEGG